MEPKNYYLGTAVKITVMLNIATASTATITIDNPSETVMIDSAAMTKAADGVYTYIYQSTSTDEEGTYIATISASYGGYTAVVQDSFILVEQE